MALILMLLYFRQSQTPNEQFAELYIHETDAKWSFVFNTERSNTTFDVRYRNLYEYNNVGTFLY